MRIIVGHFSTYNVGLLGLSRNDYISHYCIISKFLVELRNIRGIYSQLTFYMTV